MKRSEINAVVREAREAFERHGWALPPNPRWDVTDFGLGQFDVFGLTLVNLAEEPEYCEKLMYARRDQITLEHHHASKKEDIICRWGRLAIQIHADAPKSGRTPLRPDFGQGAGDSRRTPVELKVNGEMRAVPVDQPLVLKAGERVTLTQGVRHSFWPDGNYAIIGEVSTANDDAHDNYFANPDVGRFSKIEEDEPTIVKLVSD